MAMTNDARALVRRAQQQTAANRYAFLIRQLSAKVVEKIRNS